MLVDIVLPTEIESGIAPVIVCVLALGKKFAAKREMFAKIALQEPTAKWLVTLTRG